MGSAKKTSLFLLFTLLILNSLVGCDSIYLQSSSDSGKSSKQPSQTTIASITIPKDIRILDGAKDVTAVQTGDGVTKGDGFCQLSFHVGTSIEETAKIYRAILTDNKYDYNDEPIADSVSISGSTPNWVFFITIAKSSEFKGDTSVTTAYTK